MCSCQPGERVVLLFQVYIKDVAATEFVRFDDLRDVYLQHRLSKELDATVYVHAHLN